MHNTKFIRLADAQMFSFIQNADAFRFYCSNQT